MIQQLALGLDLDQSTPYVDPDEIDAKIRSVEAAIGRMNLAELTAFFEQLERWPTTAQAWTSPLREVRWLNRHDGRHHKRRAMAAVRAEIEQRVKGGA